MFWGDVLLTGCCAFYLLWWVLAFKPTGAVTGMRSGWLLIPALLLGCAAVFLIVRGALAAPAAETFFSPGKILAGGVIAYVALLLVTLLAFHRQVTTELVLIVGWTVIAVLECDALFGMGLLPRGATIGLFAAALVAAALSMVCYVLYYDLVDWAGYVDGMVPLLLVAVYMAALAVWLALVGR